MKIWLTTGLVIVSCFSILWGQANSDVVADASTWKELGDRYRKANVHDSAAMYYDLAARAFQQSNNWKQVVRSRSFQGRSLLLLNKQKEGLDMMEQSIHIGESKLSELDTELAKAYGRLAGYHLSQGNHLSAKDLYNKSLRIKEALPDSFTVTSRSGTYVNVGTAYHRLGFLVEAENMHHRGLQLLEEHQKNNHRTASIAHSMLAMVLMEKRDYQSAIDHLHKSLDIKLSVSHVDSLLLAQTLMNIGLAHFYKKDLEEAQHYYEQVVQIQTVRLGDLHPSMANIYLNLGALYQSQEQYDLALSYYERVEQIFLQQGNTSHLRLANNFINQGLIYNALKDWDQALHFLRLALAQLSKHHPRHPELAKCLMVIGSIHQVQNSHDLAELHYQRALDVLYTDGPEQSLSQVYPLPLLLEIQGYRMENFLRSYQSTGEEKPLKEAYDISEFTIRLIDTIRLGFETADSKEILAQKTKAYYEDAIEVCWDLYQRSGDESLIWKAFQYSEKSKSLLLREALNETYAQEFAGIPAETLAEVEKVKNEIGYYQKQIFDVKREQNVSDEVTSMQGEIFDLKRKYQGLIGQLEKKYPAYYQLKYDVPDLNQKDLQAELRKSGDRMVSYFLGIRFLYTFAIDGDRCQLFRNAHTSSLYQVLPVFCQQLYDPHRISQGARSPAFFRQFTRQAYQLYEQLLAPAIAELDSGSLLIIPDGELGYLPFELLLTEEIPDSQAVDYGLLPYMMNRYRMRYEYSASLYRSVFPTKRNRKFYAGFAPIYGDRSDSLSQNLRNEFGPLTYTQNEIEEISELMDGTAFLAAQATEENFRKNGSKYNILHLAMHAYTHDEEPLYSGLVFSKSVSGEDQGLRSLNGSVRDLQEGILYTHELYNLNIDAALVVLSACNTGQGKLAKGEGILSLARAFKYAGCPNIVMSLWQVDDRATKKIMESFFGHIQEGMGKDEALRQAKLAYLRQTKDNLPFYWAPFVLIGDAQPVRPSYSFWLWGLLILIIGLGAGMAWRRSRLSHHT